jgi:arylsulfatase
MSRSDHPNLVLIMTDQQRADALGAAGNAHIHTPNLDRIAKEGIRFSNAFCTNPFCMPSRASLLTGRYAHGHRCWDNGVPLEATAVTLAHRMAEAGYHTALIGKGHLNVHRKTGSPESYEDWSNPHPRWATWHGPYYGFKEVYFTVGHNRSLGHYGLDVMSRFPEAVELFSKDKALVPPTGAPRSWKSSLPVEAHASSWIGDQTLAFLDRVGKGPFFVWVSFPDPHPSFCPPAPYCYQYDPKDIPYPVQQQGELDDKPPHFKEFFQGSLVSTWGDWDRASPDLTNVTEEQYREIVAHYYGMISLVDANVGRILDRLDERGLAEDTIIIFTSDHGELLGDHFLVGKGAFHYDSLIRVPLLWRFPAFLRGGQSIHNQVSLIDIAPTLCELTGIDPLPDVHGRSLLPLLVGEHDKVRDAVLVEFDWRWKTNMPVRTIRTPHWKLTYYAGKPYGELYNLQEDPNEFKNLYDEPGYDELKKELLLQLVDELILTGGQLPERIAPN